MKTRLFLALLVACGSSASIFSQKVISPQSAAAPVRKKIIDYSSKYEDEWIRYASTSDKVHFYNPARVSRTGAFVKVWTISRWKDSEDKSSTIWYEVNCRSSQIRSLAGVEYPQKGVIVLSRRGSWDTPKERFQAIIPESI